MDHQALVEILADNPDILKRLLSVVGPVPQDLAPLSGEVTKVVSLELRADLIFAAREQAGRMLECWIVEVQTSVDSGKRLSWPAYVTSARLRYRCPVELVVFAPDPEVARWCAQPFALTRAVSFAPTVVGPEAVPRVADLQVARGDPELALVSSLAHGRSDGGFAVVASALAAAHGVDGERGAHYADIIMATQGEVARRAMEILMATGNVEYRSDFARHYFGKGQDAGREAGRAEGREEGRAEGRAQGAAVGRVEAKIDDLIRIVRVRGLVLSPVQVERIRGTVDLEQLDTWIDRAVVVDDAGAIFG